MLCDFLEYQGLGGDFQFANFTGYNDGWGEGLINCAKSRAYASAAGQAFQFLRQQGMAWPLALETGDPSPLLRVRAAWDLKRETLVLFALNLSSRPRVVAWEIAPLKASFAGSARVESLSAPSAKLFVTENAPSPIVAAAAELPCDGRRVIFKTSPYSATAVRLQPQSPSSGGRQMREDGEGRPDV